MANFARCRHLSPVLTGCKFTTTSTPDATINRGENDFPTVARAAAGKVTLTQAESSLFTRGPIVVGQIGASIADGGFAAYDTVPGSGVITMSCLDAAGAADDGTGYLLALGFGNIDTDRFDDSQVVRCTMNDPKILGWYITNNGTVAVASGGLQAAVTRTSTGIVNIAFSPAHPQYRSFIVLPISASVRSSRITTGDGNSVVVQINDTSAVVQDCDFILLALMSGNSDGSGRCLDPLLVPQLYPEILAGRIVTTVGVPALTIGGATNGVDFTVTDNGVGDVSITLARAAGREILPIACAKASRIQLLAAPTTTVARFGMFNAAGVAADDDFDFIILTYDTIASQEF